MLARCLNKILKKKKKKRYDTILWSYNLRLICYDKWGKVVPLDPHSPLREFARERLEEAEILGKGNDTETERALLRLPSFMNQVLLLYLFI